MIGTLIVGLGWMGCSCDEGFDSGINLSHSALASSLKEFDLLGGVDKKLLAREAFEKKFHKDTFDDVIIAITEKCPSLIIVATDTASHYSTLRDIAAAGEHSSVSVVVCEKPCGNSANALEDLNSVYEKLGIRLFINYHRRALAETVKLKELVADLLPRTFFSGVCWFTNGVLNNASHFIDLVSFLFPQARLRLTSVLSSEKGVRFVLTGTCVEIIFIEVQSVPFEYCEIELVYDAGVLRYGGGGRYLRHGHVVNDPIYNGYNVISPLADFLHSSLDEATSKVFGEINRVFCGQKTTLCTGLEAVSTLRIIEQIQGQEKEGNIR